MSGEKRVLMDPAVVRPVGRDPMERHWLGRRESTTSVSAASSRFARLAGA
jgi:hypothetical protein